MKKSKFTFKRKELRRIFSLSLVFLSLMLMMHLTQAQIQFVGMEADGEGAAAWNADGTGPEPAGTGPQIPFPGFGEEYYYGSSRDYIDGNPDGAGGHVTEINGFPAFEQALTNNGFLMADVKIKINPYNMGEYSIGGTCFVIGSWWHSLFFEHEFVLTIGGEDAINGIYKYTNIFINQYGTSWALETSFTRPVNISGSSSPEVQAVANAFFEDLGDDEIRYILDDMVNAGSITGNGRSGAFYNIISSYIEKGKPTLPFNGLAVNHQGSIGWDADGTGPEPPGAQSNSWLTYYASRDYDSIDPDPNAAFGSLEEEMKGFLNFKLQLLYRGFTPEQVLIKNGLSSLGDHIEGVDWGEDWVKYYGSEYHLELNGEMLLEGLHDTLTAFDDILGGFSSVDLPKDVTNDASVDAQWIAGGLMSDLEDRKLKFTLGSQTFASGSVTGNGRNGHFYNVLDGKFEAVPHQSTFIQCDTLINDPPNPITWNLSGSPYYIDQDVVLAEGDTLIIHPGVKVAFRGPYTMEVNGIVHANGSTDEPIIFTRSNWEPRWDGIIFDNITAGTDSSLLINCTFEYAYALPSSIAGRNSGAAIKVIGFDKLRIDNCIFQHNLVDQDGTLPPSGAGIGLWDASIHIKNTIFRYNTAKYGGGLICYDGSDGLIEHCLFHDNHAETYGGAIEVYAAAPIFKNNTVVYNTCLIYGGGFDIQQECNPVTFENNIIYGNKKILNDTAFKPHQISFDTHNNVISLNYNDIEGGIDSFYGSYTIAQNNVTIDADPIFCLMDSLDYHLAFESPCCSQPGCPLPGYMGAFTANCHVSLPEVSDYCGELIYPNPVAEGTVRLRIGLNAGDDLKVEIYDMLGHQHAGIQAENLGEGEQEFILPVETLKPGTYVIRIYKGTAVSSAKLIKLR